MKLLYLRITVGVIIALLLPTAALAVTVVVNGQPLPPYPPALQRQGRVMLPMRMVFESLGAEVKWEAVSRTAIGIRGDITVRMSINSRVAFINERSVILDVPPQLIGGLTYMPVRFPAEAFGADVGWHGPSQTVTISLAPLAEVEPPQPPLPPEPPPQPPEPPEQPPEPRPGTVTGVISAARANQLAVIVGDQIEMFTVTAQTIILRDNQQVAAAQLYAGEQARITHDGQGKAMIVRISYETAEGVVLAKVLSQILLDTRPQPLQVRPQVVVVTSEGVQSGYTNLKNGDRVVAHLTPGTNNVFKIVIQPSEEQEPEEPPAEPEKPVIARFYHDADSPLRSGDLLRVTLEGTSGGIARFDIGDKVENRQMNESRQRLGRYKASYRIPANLNVLRVPLVGHLDVGGQSADPVHSAEPITIDTVPPVVTIFGPEDNEQTTNPQPNIAVLIGDENGSGIDYDRATATIHAGAQEHPVTVTRQGQLLTVAVAVPLPQARIILTVDAYDLAGNLTRTTRAFDVVGAEEAPQTVSASHDAVGMVLAPGEHFIVTATGPAGAQGTFDVGEWQQELTLPELPEEPGTYQGIFLVPEITEDREEIVTVYLRFAPDQELTAEAPAPVLFGPRRILQPTITSPIEGEQVGEEVVVVGTTEPLAEVSCVISYEGQLWILPLAGQISETRVTADETGNFRTDPISLGLDFKVKKLKYTLTCVARSPRGEESEPVIVKFVP